MLFNNVTPNQLAEAPRDISMIHLTWMIGNSYEYDYVYSDKLDIYEARNNYKIVGIETLRKGELISRTIIDICNNN